MMSTNPQNSDSNSTLSSRISHLIDSKDHWVSNLANISTFLGSEVERINWIGFYFVFNRQLHLGPFWGKPACTRIDFGKGVVGNSAQLKKTINVPDVDQFPGHIVCDSASRSELVVPIFNSQNRLVAILDIDSAELDRFSTDDVRIFEDVAQVIGSQIDWELVNCVRY